MLKRLDNITNFSDKRKNDSIYKKGFEVLQQIKNEHKDDYEALIYALTSNIQEIMLNCSALKFGVHTALMDYDVCTFQY